MIVTRADGRWQTQILKRLGWYIGIKRGAYSPQGASGAPVWAVPLDGWITDPKEMENAIRLDGLMGIKSKEDK